MNTKYTLKTVVALVIRAVGLVAIVIGVFLLWRWFMADVFPYFLVRKPHNGVGFWIFRDIGGVLTAFGVVCRLVARRMLQQRVAAHESAGAGRRAERWKSLDGEELVASAAKAANSFGLLLCPDRSVKRVGAVVPKCFSHPL